MAEPVGYTAQGIPIYEPIRSVDVDTWDAESSVKAAIPLLDSQHKMDYLMYRACGFTVREAASLCGLTQKTIKHWRLRDEAFRRWEEQGLAELQRTVSDVILRSQFTRNMHVVLKIDGRALLDVALAKDWKDIPAEKLDWAKEASKRYKAQDLALILKALEPESDIGTQSQVNITVNIDNVAVEEETAQRAASRKLLADFTRNVSVVEATARLIDDGSSES